MNCEEVQKYLMDFLDKSLDLIPVQEIEEHLSGCAPCSEELASLTACQRLVSSLPAVDPPINFTARVMAEVRKAAHRQSFWERLFFPLRMKIPLQATGLVLIAVLAAYVYEKEPLQQELIDAAPSKEAKAFPNASEREKSAESPAGAPATDLAQEQVRPPAMLAPGPKSSTLSAGASPRLEKSSPPGPVQAKGALAPVPPTETDNALKGASAVGKSLVSPDPRESNVASSLDTSSGPLLAADYELAIRLKKPAPDGQATAHRFESDPSQVEGRSSRLQQETKTLDQARQRAIETGETQTVWLTIPRDQYELLKKDLAGMGNIEMESPTVPRKNDTISKSSDQLRMKVTILPSLPAGSPLPSKPLNP